MVDLWTFQQYPDPFRPRRIMKYVLVYCQKGSLTLMVDDKEIVLKAKQVLTITSGQYHYWLPFKKAEGTVLEFTLHFFCKNDADFELVFHNSLFCHFDYNEVISMSGHPIIEAQLAEIGKELKQQPYQYLISIHSRIELILVEINRSKIARGDEIWKPSALFLKFLDAVRSNFENQLTLADYAAMLDTTYAKLNALARQHAGKTAQMVIQGLVSSEAKRMLTYENLSVKEVAYKLGFRDPFYFSNFFKKHNRISPKTYQDRHAI